MNDPIRPYLPIYLSGPSLFSAHPPPLSPDLARLGAAALSHGVDPSTIAELFGAPTPAQRFFAPPAGIDWSLDPDLLASVRASMLSGGATPVGAIGGVAGVGGVDLLSLALSDGELRYGAMRAIRQGRTSLGSRGTRATPERIRRALAEDWTPRAGGRDASGVIRMSQLDYRDRLGNGHQTIRSAGCLLTSMAMASTVLGGKRAASTPREANARVRDAGGFSGGMLRVDTAARALGMKVISRRPASGRSLAALDRSLAAGRPVVAGVDYRAGRSSSVSGADHFITITGRRSDGSYTAIDPAGGRRIRLVRSGDSLVGPRGYRVSEVIQLDRRAP